MDPQKPHQPDHLGGAPLSKPQFVPMPRRQHPEGDGGRGGNTISKQWAPSAGLWVLPPPGHPDWHSNNPAERGELAGESKREGRGAGENRERSGLAASYGIPPVDDPAWKGFGLSGNSLVTQRGTQAGGGEERAALAPRQTLAQSMGLPPPQDTAWTGFSQVTSPSRGGELGPHPKLLRVPTDEDMLRRFAGPSKAHRSLAGRGAWIHDTTLEVPSASASRAPTPNSEYETKKNAPSSHAHPIEEPPLHHGAQSYQFVQYPAFGSGVENEDHSGPGLGGHPTSRSSPTAEQRRSRSPDDERTGSSSRTGRGGATASNERKRFCEKLSDIQKHMLNNYLLINYEQVQLPEEMVLKNGQIVKIHIPTIEAVAATMNLQAQKENQKLENQGGYPKYPENATEEEIQACLRHLDRNRVRSGIPGPGRLRPCYPFVVRGTDPDAKNVAVEPKNIDYCYEILTIQWIRQVMHTEPNIQYLVGFENVIKSSVPT
ncbi:hypothetical protein T439DRAFT_154639 [Meredithblackwellia eburnea MCA 4105]